MGRCDWADWSLDGDVLIAEGRPAAESGRVLARKYRLGNLIGEGGMGQVFKLQGLDEFLAQEIAKWTRVAKAAGLAAN